MYFIEKEFPMTSEDLYKSMKDTLIQYVEEGFTIIAVYPDREAVFTTCGGMSCQLTKVFKILLSNEVN